MSSKTIRIDLNDMASVKDALGQIARMSEKLAQLDAFLEKMAGYGVEIAQSAYDRGFNYNPYGGDYGNVTVTARDIEGGFVIEANGEQVCFMEFGAGVTYSGEAYEGELPDGIVGIGEFGKGNGNRKAWAYYSTRDLNFFHKSNAIVTYGVPALQGMYNAKTLIMEETRQFFEELLND